MKKNSLCYLVVVTFMLIGVSCSNSNKTTNTTDEVVEVDMESATANKFESMFSAPSPEELMMLFEDSGMKFNANAVNDPENISKYMGSKALSLNLGVYVTDAAYLNMFAQYSQMTSYLESVFKITDKLDIGGVYLEFDFKKVFREMDNPDSLIVLSEGVYHAVTEYMVDNSKEEMLCLISHGSIIELLYLAFESIGDFNANDPVLQHISDQQMQIDNLIEFANQYTDNADIVEVISDLEKMKKVWGDVSEEVSETVVSNKEGTLSISGGTKHNFSKEQYELLKTTIKEIRTKIIS